MNIHLFFSVRFRWSFVNARKEIIVKLGNTELPRDYLVVSGFTVDGQVLNDNHPIENIGIVMLSSDKVSNLEC